MAEPRTEAGQRLAALAGAYGIDAHDLRAAILAIEAEAQDTAASSGLREALALIADEADQAVVAPYSALATIKSVARAALANPIRVFPSRRTDAVR